MESSRIGSSKMEQFKNRSKTELLDMLERQKRLLEKTQFISKLPDKGDKIRRQKARLEKALAQHGDVDETANLFQRLNLDQHKVHDRQDLDSNDDVPGSDSSRVHGSVLDEQKENVVLASVPHASNGPSRNTSKSTTHHEPFVVKLTQRLEPDSGRPAHLLYHFRPNSIGQLRTTKIKDVVPNHAHVDRPIVWYETAVTPPPPTFNEARLIPLKDSYDLAKHHEETLRELAIIQATKQLALHTEVTADASFHEADRTQFRDSLEDQDSEED